MLCLCANEDLLMPGGLSFLPCRADYNKVTRQHILSSNYLSRKQNVLKLICIRSHLKENTEKQMKENEKHLEISEVLSFSTPVVILFSSVSLLSLLLQSQALAD